MAGQAEEPGERLQIGGFHHYHSLVRQPTSGTCTRSNTYIGGSQRLCVVDAVAHHNHLLPLQAEFADKGLLILRLGVGHVTDDAQLPRYGRSGTLTVARQHTDVQPLPPKLFDYPGSGRFQSVLDGYYGKQLILTSDRAPVLLQGMEERLITRFKWGMVAELEKPTVELRKNILRNKIHRDGLQFPQEVIDYIAENVGDSVRDLEGIVISIMAHSTIYNKEIDLELTQRIVRKVVNSESKAVTVDEIINTVCKHFGLETATIHTKSRKREVVQARQIAMYLAKKHTDFSTAKIGTLIGNKDHATVLHACKTIKQLKEVDKSFRAEIEEIQTALKKV